MGCSCICFEKCCHYLAQRYLIAGLTAICLAVSHLQRASIDIFVALSGEQQRRTETNTSHKIVCPPYFMNGSEPYVVQHEWSNSENGGIMASYYLGFIITIIPGGAISVVYGTKRILGGCILFSSLCCFIIPSTISKDNVWPLMCVRLLQGMAQGPIDPAILMVGTKWSPREERAFLIALIYTGAPVGVFLAHIIPAKMLNDKRGVDWLFYLTGGIGVVWWFVWSAYYRSYPMEHKLLSMYEKKYLARSIAYDCHVAWLATDVEKWTRTYVYQTTCTLLPWRKVFTSFQIHLICLASFSCGLGYALLEVELPLYATDILQLPVLKMGTFCAAPFASMTFGTMIFSSMSQLLVDQKIFKSNQIRRAMGFMCGPVAGLSLLVACTLHCAAVLACVLFSSAAFFWSAAATSVLLSPALLAPATAGLAAALTKLFAALAGFILPLAVHNSFYFPCVECGAGMDTRTCLVYSPQQFLPLLEGITVSPLMKAKSTSEPIPVPGSEAVLEELKEIYVSDTLYCSYCSTGFLDKHQQRAHYKLDWHRYNLKQHLAQKKTISEEKFSQLADDVSSISGSESETDETEPELSSSCESESSEAQRLSALIARRSRVLFNNLRGEVISVHRALLLNRKESAASDEHLTELVQKLPYRTNWLIVMLGGGHFAAAIFKGEEALTHKTFHSYTVRSKQGGSQSSKDSKGGHPKSAGASLRRYNEQSFSQHIRELFKTWGPEIVKCDLVFYRAVGPTNSGILFGGGTGGGGPPLLRSDPRVRAIPFPTRRATFSEVKRVQALLATAFVYDSSEMFKSSFLPPAVKEPSSTEDPPPGSPGRTGGDGEGGRRTWRGRGGPGGGSEAGSPKSSSPKKAGIDRAKPRPSPVRELPDIVQKLAAISTSGSEGDLVLVSEECSFVEDLQEFGDTVPQHIKDSMRKRVKRKKKPTTTENQEPKEALRPEVEELWKKIHASCLGGSDEELKSLLEHVGGGVAGDVAEYVAGDLRGDVADDVVGHVAEAEQGGGAVTRQEVSMILNQKNILGETILHNMAAQGKGEILRLLMLHGADPTIKDKKALTPYDHAPDKLTRNIFRRFMGDFSDMYDFSKSHIPGPLTEELESEIAEKKRAAKKAKRLKDKERRVAAETMKKEEYEKKCFLKLSDREKRALAAERRILAASGRGTQARGTSAPLVLSRCYACATDITGRVPFEYDSNRFCTMDCLKRHRAEAKKQAAS